MKDTKSTDFFDHQNEHIENSANRDFKFSVPILCLVFSQSLYPRQIPQWRGAIARNAGWENLPFHNHKKRSNESFQTAEDQYIYSYPLIQYRVIGGKAAIWGIDKGVQFIKSWQNKSNGKIRLGFKETRLHVIDQPEEVFDFQLTDQLHTYRLLDWLPLNPENYKRWLQADDLIARIELLNSILLSNLLAMAEGLGWRIPGKVDVRLLLIREMRKVRHHETDHIALNVLFKTNILLPPGIALGKGVSHGFGVLQPVKARDEG